MPCRIILDRHQHRRSFFLLTNLFFKEIVFGCIGFFKSIKVVYVRLQSTILLHDNVVDRC